MCIYCCGIFFLFKLLTLHLKNYIFISLNLILCFVPYHSIPFKSFAHISAYTHPSNHTFNHLQKHTHTHTRSLKHTHTLIVNNLNLCTTTKIARHVSPLFILFVFIFIHQKIIYYTVLFHHSFILVFSVFFCCQNRLTDHSSLFDR